MSNPIFSIIMPVYNVENYISKAIESVLKQDFLDFELILVNDCGCDDSWNICRKYNDNRLVFVENERNSGLSISRNNGVQVAKGDYVIFVDSDDWVEQNFLSIAFEYLSKYKTDMLILGYTEEYINDTGICKFRKIIVNNEYCRVEKYEKITAVIDIVFKPIFRYAWNKIYNRDFLIKNKFEFSNVIMVEDVLFNINVFEKFPKILILNMSLYHYQIRKNSNLSSLYYDNYWDNHLLLVERKEELLKKLNCIKLFKDILFFEYIKYIYMTLQNSFLPGSKWNFKDRLKFLKIVRREPFYFIYVGNVGYTSFKQYILSLSVIKKYDVLTILISYIIFIIKNKFDRLYNNVKNC